MSKKIQIVADSVCDVPKDLIEELDVMIIPCYVNYGGKSHADNGKDLIREDYYRAMPTMTDQPTTAAPSPGDAEELYREALENADHVISIHVPEQLSATMNAMRLGAEGVDKERITLVDGLQLSVGIGFQVIESAKTAKETGDVQKVLDTIEQVRQKTQLYAAIETMEYLKRSGRVSGLVASVGSILRINPVVYVWDGAIHSHSRVRTFKKAVDKLAELAHEQAPLNKLAILHIDNIDGANDLKTRLSDIAPEETYIIEVTPVLGTHLGPGCLGVTTLQQNWRQ